MFLIRKGTFETNSSSTHSFTMCSGKEYDAWEKGELLYWACNDKFVKANSEEEDMHYRKCLINQGIERNYEDKTLTYKGVTVPYTWKTWDEDIKAFYTPENLNEFTKEQVQELIEEGLDDEDKLLSYDEYFEKHDEYYETFDHTYTTPNGEEVVAFGYYGHD